MEPGGRRERQAERREQQRRRSSPQQHAPARPAVSCPRVWRAVRRLRGDCSKHRQAQKRARRRGKKQTETIKSRNYAWKRVRGERGPAAALIANAAAAASAPAGTAILLPPETRAARPAPVARSEQTSAGKQRQAKTARGDESGRRCRPTRPRDGNSSRKRVRKARTCRTSSLFPVAGIDNPPRRRGP